MDSLKELKARLLESNTPLMPPPAAPGRTRVLYDEIFEKDPEYQLPLWVGDNTHAVISAPASMMGGL